MAGEQWLLPFDFSDAQAIGATMFKKQIAPLDATVESGGRKYKFSSDVLQGILKTFYQRPIESVPITLVDDKNMHTDDPERNRGTVEDLSIEKDGLYMIGKLDERGQAMVKANPRLGASMRYVPRFPSTDGQVYDHGLLHVAVTPRGRLQTKPWEQVELSDAEKERELEVVDLSEGEWELSADTENRETEEELKDEKKGGAQGETQEGVSTEETSAQTKSDEKKVEEVNLSAESVQEMIDLAVGEAVKNERERAQGEITALRMKTKVGEVERAVERFVDAGVPPFVANLAAPLLLENEPEGEAVKYMDLSEDTKTEKEAPRYQLVTKILEAWPKEVDLSEEDGTREGASDGSPTDTDAMWKAWKDRSAPSGMSASGASSTEGGE